MSSSRPLLLVAGFLGSGKTSLIRSLLAQFLRRNIKADVILNDIANASVDAASINPDHAASISPLAASCACCESLEELLSLCRTANEGEGDLLLIELNGTADPLGVLEPFALLRRELSISPMIHACVIDVRHWGKRGELTALEERQMRGAGLYLLSHQDLVTNTEIEAVENVVTDAFPESFQTDASQLADLLVSATLEGAGDGVSGSREWPQFSAVKCREDHVHLLSHQVRGCEIPLPPKVRRAGIEQLLMNLPDNVLRAKALVKTVEDPGSQWLFERCGREVSPSPLPVPAGTRIPSSLLCMGMNLDSAAIRMLVSEEFGYVPVMSD